MRETKGERKRFLDIIFRYVLLMLIAVPGLDLFYFIFLPLTKYPAFWALQPLYDPILLANTIFIGNRAIEIIGACVAGSAYFLLLILNLATSGIGLVKRLKLLLFTFGTFFIINVIRIYILSIMYLEGSAMFDITHKLFWYLGSTLFVVLIWFAGVFIFKVEEIPFYTDLKHMYQSSIMGGKKKFKREQKARNLKPEAGKKKKKKAI
ncbi:MAG: pacearchaeosortase [Nanoarchaeota archaeon]|jgi:exosortase/archaeosortase family protein|nr:pacearchaeosortase [Nanoarchaeota archaeon]